MHIATLKVYQAGEEAPEFGVQWNGTNIPLEVISSTRIGEGQYELEINKPILDTGTLGKWYIANSSSQKYAVSYGSQTVISIQSFEADTTPKDGVLGWNEVEIHV